MVEMVCFIESLAESETPFEITDVSRGSMFLSILAITEKPRSRLAFWVETNSSETPPPLRQHTATAEDGRDRRLATAAARKRGKVR